MGCGGLSKISAAVMLSSATTMHLSERQQERIVPRRKVAQEQDVRGERERARQHQQVADLDVEVGASAKGAPAPPLPAPTPIQALRGATGAGAARQTTGTITTDSPVMKPALAGVVSFSPAV